MKVRKRFVIIFSLFLVIVCLLSVYIINPYKKTNDDNKIKSENQIKYNVENADNCNTELDNNTFPNFKSEGNNTLLSGNLKAQVEKRVIAAKDDMKNSFNLMDNIEQYIELDLNTIPEFIKKGYKDYFDATHCTEFIVKIDDYRHYLPIGSVKPLILINKNGKELIFAYKEADGKNVIKRAIRQDNAWFESEDIKQGSPILEIHKSPIS